MNDIPQIPEDFPISNILVVDDDPSLRLVVTRSLERAGFNCRPAEDAKTALDMIKANSADLVISDISMPGGMDGIDLLKIIRRDYPETSVIIMTGYGSDYSYVDIMDAGASDYMTKPFNMNSALARINRIAREKINLINLKKSNQELCRAIERSNVLAREAKEASKAKTFFLASMSHEIRTPLNGIVGYTDMLMDTPLNDEQQMFLKNARLSCETLLSVVNDILDFSKVEAGKLTLEHIGFDPEVVCYDTIDVVRPKVDESKVELLCAVDDAVPAKVIGDPHRFRQVLLNLLGNAVKFTQKGYIKLSINCENEEDDHIRLIVRVEDTGIGIAENQLQKIFHPFVQSEDDITNRYGGTGLGLAISKNIAGKMNGDIRAKSVVNKGSVFYFSSIVKIGEPKAVSRVKSAPLKGKRVLLVTTSQDSFKLMAHDFLLADMEMTHIPYAELAQRLSDIKPESYHIGIIDFGKLPKISNDNFKEILERISIKQFSFNFVACSIPVPGIAGVFQDAGFKGYLPKPIPRQKLFEMIAYVMGISNSKTAPVTSQPELITSHSISENKKQSVSILLVEDNPVNQKMTHLMLTKAGYQIDIAGNGQEAVDKFSAAPEQYDLIFMDINMPVMDGFSATRKIRDLEKCGQVEGHIPILALTANVLDDFKSKCVQSGMDDFLTKPIKRDVVFKTIQRWAR